MNPWYLERRAEYERDRIQRDMKQIRLEEKAMQAGRTEEKTTEPRFSHTGWLMLIVSTLTKWMFCVGR